MTNRKTIDGIVGKLFADIEFTQEPKGLYDPLRYMIAIGGKRIRPTLCLLTWALYRDDFPEEILEPAAALEVFHTFTLIHDDIMDRSPLRRGQDTVWKKWNEDTAILSGDVMQIDAYRRLAKAPSARIGSALDLFSRTAAEVCEGQQFDMEFENRPEVTMDEYSRMIGLKTAVLIACSAKMGALLAGAPAEDCEALYRYGYELGMAFQVADDWLDAFGDQKVFGKPIGGDIINGKKSWLTVRTLEKTDDRAAFQAAMRLPSRTAEQREAKIAAVKAIYEACGVDEDAKAEIVRYSGRALKAVCALRLPEDGLEALRDFAEKLVGRAK